MEILSPAGNYEKFEAAVLYGADAVYLAGQTFGMRAAAQNFTLDEIKRAAAYAHSLGRKVYLTVNTMPRWHEYEQLDSYLYSLDGSGVDALIVADIGVMARAREIVPSIPLHVSTQSSTVSHVTCTELQKLGASRVVLARELTLNEIKEIKKRISGELELETFIHGSMCVSYSGRCLLSEYMVKRDANRGMCAQPCRWNYEIFEISEEKRPEMRLPVEQHDGETFIMSSKDMCMIEHIPELCESGIYSFKIEGRMKSAYYTAVITNAYRMAIDRYLADPAGYRFDEKLLYEVESVSHREYCTGYYFDDAASEPQLCRNPGYLREKAYIATVVDYDAERGIARMIQRNKLSEGDDVEMISPGKTGRPFKAEALFSESGERIESAPHPSMLFDLKVPFEVKKGDILRS